MGRGRDLQAELLGQRFVMEWRHLRGAAALGAAAGARVHRHTHWVDDVAGSHVRSLDVRPQAELRGQPAVGRGRDLQEELL